jgi:Holliday junction DNA helicase RuvA
MISRLRGQVTERSEGSIVLDVHGVGYEVFVAQRTLQALPDAPETCDLHIRLINRDGEWDLYGFPAQFDRKLFDLVTSVNGVGPRSALGLLDLLGADALATTIAKKDASALTGAVGVGPKLAQRIVLEVSERAAELALEHRAVTQAGVPVGAASDVEAALVSLGYTRSEARRAAQTAIGTAPDAPVEELVRLALASVAAG